MSKDAKNACLEILKVKRWYIEVKVSVRVLKPTGALVSKADLDEKQCFKVFVDFFDSEGDPIGGVGQYIHNSPNEMLPGEIISLYFELPYGAESCKAWLPE